MENEKNKNQCQMSLVLLTYWIIVIAAKIIRYTVLKKSLVNLSIGYGWIGKLSAGMNPFLFSIKGDSVASQNSIAIFQFFRFFGLNTYEEYELIITLIWNLIFFRILLTLKKEISIFHTFFIMMSIAVLNIWDFCLAKEPLQMIYFVIIYYVLISNKINDKYKFIISLAIVLLSCFTYRSYYLLIVIFSIFSYLVIKKYLVRKERITKFDLIKIIIGFAILYVLIVLYAKYFNQEAYNCFTYFNRRETAANTDLSGIFRSDNLFLMGVDSILLVFRMLFPVELIRLGPEYYLYIIYQIIISIITIEALVNIRKNEKINIYAIHIFLGFLFASATFEPDFGSWVRHEAVTIPILLIMANLVDRESKKEKELSLEK